jgi:hypothetical protein
MSAHTRPGKKVDTANVMVEMDFAESLPGQARSRAVAGRPAQGTDGTTQ